jgi:outer membrane lipoprotein SlyB
MKKLMAIATLVLCTSAFAQFSGTDYNAGEVRRAKPAQTGTVIDIVDSGITAEASNSSRVVGAAAAGLACGLGTRNVSNWSTRSAVVGLCGLVGERVGNYVGSQNRRASTLLVRLANGSVVAVAQEDPQIRPGAQVYVLAGGSTTRVVLASAQNSYGR